MAFSCYLLSPPKTTIIISGPILCWRYCITKSNWHLLVLNILTFLNFNFIRFSLNEPYLNLLKAMWEVIKQFWIREQTFFHVFVFLCPLFFPIPLILQLCQKSHHKKSLVISVPVIGCRFWVWTILQRYIPFLLMQWVDEKKTLSLLTRVGK